MTSQDEQNRFEEPRTGIPVDMSKEPHSHGIDNTPVPHEDNFPFGQARQSHDNDSLTMGDEIGTAR